MTALTQYIGPDAVGALQRYAQAQGMSKFYLVADERTWPVLGRSVQSALSANGADVVNVVLQGNAIAADGDRIIEILLPGATHERTLIAVGAGTITDLTRFVSHRTGHPFIAMPTAPSSDAFASANAPIILHGLKRTFQAQQPIAIFADLDVLCAAPAEMIAAGVGDILGKYTALADWRLGALILDEAIDEAILADMVAVLHGVASRVQAIGQREPAAIAALMQGLLDSGSAMARWVNSRPASGSEHLMSHYWEMRLLQQGRPAVLHGAKVGVATVLMARAYEHLRAISHQNTIQMVARTPARDANELRTRIRAGYGSLAESIIEEHRDVLAILDDLWAKLESRLEERWDQVLAIAADVPSPDTITAQLQAAGAPTRPAELGFTALETDDALRYSHLLRNRLTVRWVERGLGLN